MSLLRSLLLKKNYRNEQRTQNNLLTCQVTGQDPHSAFAVKVLDVSPGGMAFAVKGAAFNVGESLQIKFLNGLSEEIRCDGEILSQLIFYPGKNEDIKHAVFRFSVKFKTGIAPSAFLELHSRFQEQRPAV